MCAGRSQRWSSRSRPLNLGVLICARDGCSGSTSGSGLANCLSAGRRWSAGWRSPELLPMAMVPSSRNRPSRAADQRIADRRNLSTSTFALASLCVVVSWRPVVFPLRNGDGTRTRSRDVKVPLVSLCPYRCTVAIWAGASMLPISSPGTASHADSRCLPVCCNQAWASAVDKVASVGAF